MSKAKTGIGTGTVITLGVLGIGGALLWRTRGAGSQAVNDLVAQTLAALDAATSRASGIGNTPAAPKGQTSQGATTAPLPRDVLLGVLNAPREPDEIRPVVNLATGRAYQPVLAANNEVIYHGAAGDDWVMRNGEWVRI